MELWRWAYGCASPPVSDSLGEVIPPFHMSGHPSEPIGYVEQFKTDLWCSRAQRQSPDLASLLTVVLGCPLLGVRHASDGPPVDLSRYPRRSRNATESIRVPTLCFPDQLPVLHSSLLPRHPYWCNARQTASVPPDRHARHFDHRGECKCPVSSNERCKWA